jgi:hypothetical protein
MSLRDAFGTDSTAFCLTRSETRISNLRPVACCALHFLAFSNLANVCGSRARREYSPSNHTTRIGSAIPDRSRFLLPYCTVQPASSAPSCAELRLHSSPVSALTLTLLKASRRRGAAPTAKSPNKLVELGRIATYEPAWAPGPAARFN